MSRTSDYKYLHRCSECGRFFHTNIPNEQYCSKECRNEYKITERWIKKRKRGAASGEYNQIFETKGVYRRKIENYGRDEKRKVLL